MTAKTLVTISLAVLLVACTSAHRNTSSQAMPTPADDAAARQLAEAATSVSDSLSDLAAIERATKPVRRTLIDPSEAQMPGKVSIDSAGDVEPLLQRLGAISGYRVRILGSKPAIPVLVTISARNIPLSYVVRDIDAQCGKRAQLFIYPQSRVLELRYAKG